MYEVIEKIKNAESVAVCPHINEDPDALGSSFAFCMALRKLGKEAVCYVSERPLPRLDFIGTDYVVYEKGMQTNYDLCVCLDCGDLERLGDRKKLFESINNTVNIDHHETNTMFADANYVEGDTSATGEILCKLIPKLGIEIDKEIARCLYIAISSDTGCFKYSNVKPDTLRHTADLIEYGFDHAETARLLFDTESFEITKINAELMQKIESFADGKIMLIAVDNDLYDKYGITSEHIPDAVNIPRRIEGCEIAVCLKRKTDGIGVNLRSNGNSDVSKVALFFGGGGHRAAAGCTVRGMEMDELKEKVISECEKAIR